MYGDFCNEDNQGSFQKWCATVDRSIFRWNELLQAKGGVLSKHKCLFYIIKWEWVKDKYSLCSHDTLNPEVIGSDCPTLSQCTFKDSSHASHYLNIRLVPSGQMDDESTYRVEQSSALALRILDTQLTSYETYVLYHRIWLRPQIQYCLPITTFTEAQCIKIHKPMLNAFIANRGYNRKMPREVVFGDIAKGGLGIRSVHTLQGIAHIQEALVRLRKNNSIGKHLHILSQIVQLEGGTSEVVFSNTHLAEEYGTPTWFSSTWDFLSRYNLSISFPGQLHITNAREKDSILMNQIALFYKGTTLKTHQFMQNVASGFITR